MLEMINGWPLVVKIIVTILAVAWGIEIFLLPFKFNIYTNRQKGIEQILRQILAAVNKNETPRDLRRTVIINDLLDNIVEKEIERRNKEGGDNN